MRAKKPPVDRKANEAGIECSIKIRRKQNAVEGIKAFLVCAVGPKV
jgi:hypothetical protein